jgi:Short C-terminal domain/Phospholipase_D-nuclease N-terminal
MVFAEDFGTGQVFWSMLWLFLFVIWVWLLFVVFGDIFRSDDLSGWGKALWSIFIIVVPYLGIFVYLIARGHKMQQHQVEAAAAQDAAMKSYIRNAAGSGGDSAVDQLARLAELKEKGVISDEEFQQLKAKAMS